MLEENETRAAAPEPTDAPVAPSPAAVAVESWFVEYIHNSPASRDTAIFNHVRQAVDVLKQRLSAL